MLPFLNHQTQFLQKSGTSFEVPTGLNFVLYSKHFKLLSSQCAYRKFFPLNLFFPFHSRKSHARSSPLPVILAFELPQSAFPSHVENYLDEMQQLVQFSAVLVLVLPHSVQNRGRQGHCTCIFQHRQSKLQICFTIASQTL